MDWHVHLHAVVPGGGPSPCGRRWVRTRHKVQRRRRQPCLVDNELLGRRFREKFLAGLKRLQRRGAIEFRPPAPPGEEGLDFAAWAEQVAEQWNVYIQPPPATGADPEHVLKYLARYLTGGPISDRRLISHQRGQVSFRARSKEKKNGNRSRPFTLSGREFVRRWAMHILPKGLTKSRSYGGFSNRHRHNYLNRCRALLKLNDREAKADPLGEAPEGECQPSKTCPHCRAPLSCTSAVRPSWREVLSVHATCPLWYQPLAQLSRDARQRIREPEP